MVGQDTAAEEELAASVWQLSRSIQVVPYQQVNDPIISTRSAPSSKERPPPSSILPFTH